MFLFDLYSLQIKKKNLLKTQLWLYMSLYILPFFFFFCLTLEHNHLPWYSKLFLNIILNCCNDILSFLTIPLGPLQSFFFCKYKYDLGIIFAPNSFSVCKDYFSKIDSQKWLVGVTRLFTKWTVFLCHLPATYKSF